MFLFRKPRPLSLESLDARVREIEARLAVRDAPTRDNGACQGGRVTLEGALESYARSAGLNMPKRQD
jgi:hypothetical protein